MRRCVDTIIHDQADGPVPADAPVTRPEPDAQPAPVAADAEEATLSAAVAATRRRRPASEE